MTQKSQKRLKKVFFPLGVFFLVYIIQALISIGAVGFYFIHNGSERINDIVTYTKNYSLTMGDAFADAAELSYRAGSYTTLKSLYQEKIRKNTIDEAFFALKNGKIMVHSSKETVKELKGNLANDEFSYNLDMIQQPLKEKKGSITFTDYNIIELRTPFKRRKRKLLQKYLYEPIESTGWLVTRAVFSKNKPVGTVSFIISKKRVFNYIKGHIETSRRYLTRALAGSGVCAFFISLFVFFRYRSIQKKTEKIVAARTGAQPAAGQKIRPVTPLPLPGEGTVAAEPAAAEDGFTIDLSAEPAETAESESISMDELVSLDGKTAATDISTKITAMKNRQVKDPIPAKEKESSHDLH